MTDESSPMRSRLSWRTAARIAFRDLAASRGKFLIIALAVAAGVGALAGVRGFGRSFRAMLRADARTLMAADLSVRAFAPPTPDQTALLEGLAAGGARRTEVIETVSMLSGTGDEHAARPPLLVAVKAVEPGRYPFYGELVLEPSVTLDASSMAVSEDLLVRTPLRVGDTARLGEADFRIAAVVRKEPDRMTGSLNVGTRILITRSGLDRTGIMKAGSRAAHRQLLRIDPERQDVQRIRRQLARAFPGALVTDYRETHPLITRGLDRAERFLSLVCLVAMIIGAVGVGATIHAHIEQRMDTIAVMKCLGARSDHVTRIFLIQTLATGVAGGLAGCLLGMAVQAMLPALIRQFFPSAPAFRPDPLAALEALAIGVLTAVLFAWPALLGVERVRPLAIVRRDVQRESEGTPWKAWAARAAILAGITALAIWLTDGHLRTGGYFAGGLLAGLAVLSGFSWLLLALLRQAPRRALPASLRQGIANLYRPGNQARAVLVSFGIGVMFTLTVYLVQGGVLAQILANAPPDMPNVFMINITSREKAGMEKLIAAQPVEGNVEMTAVIAARLQSVEGRRIDSFDRGDRRRSYGGTRGITTLAGRRKQIDVVRGEWWDASKPQPGLVCIREDMAETLGVKPGTRMSWLAGMDAVEATVACIFRAEQVRMGASLEVIFSPGSLDHLPLQYFAAIRLKPGAVAHFQRQAFEAFPSVTVINGADVIEIVQGVVDQIAVVIRFLSAFAIAAGVILLVSAVAATRFRRTQEAAILKALGATRRRIIAIFSVEFLVLGSAAGLLGALLASAFANLLIVQIFSGRARFDAPATFAAVAAAAFTANAAGWLASWRILDRKPFEVLRGE